MIIHHRSTQTVVVAGLRWSASDTGMGRAEARTRAKGMGAHAYLLRALDRNLATITLPGKITTWRGKHIVPLGSALADLVQAEAWCGVFEVEDRYVYLATSGGSILPDTDHIYATPDEAKARLAAEMPLFDVVYSPDNWQLSGTLSSSELVASVDWQDAAAMQLLSGRKSVSGRALLLGAGAILLLGAVGYRHWQNAKIEQENAERAQRSTPVSVNPWAAKSKPDAAVKACRSARIQMASLSQYGWALETLECNVEGDRFSATLAPYTSRPVLPPSDMNVAFKNDGSGLTVSGPLNVVRGHARDAEIGNLETVMAARTIIVSYAQSAAWQVEGNRHDFSFTTAVSLQDMADRFTTLPTLSLNRIELSGDQWRADGEIFQ